MCNFGWLVFDTETNDEEDLEPMVDSRVPRGNRPIFECYWNGRLIPYTAIDWYVVENYRSLFMIGHVASKRKRVR